MRRAFRTLFAQEIVRFVITGLGAAGLLAALTFAALCSPLPVFVGTLLAYAATVLASYATQRAWTFRGRHSHRAALPRYCAAQIACAAGTAGLAQLLMRSGLSPGPVSLTTTLAGSAGSFLLSKLWVFPARAPRS